MIIEAGHYALVLALALSIVQASVPVYGYWRRQPVLMDMAQSTAVMQFIMVALSFAALTYAHVVSDFSLRNVVENSHSTKPMIYKISGVWGNHEGSMLLWVLILALFGALLAIFSRQMPQVLKSLTLSIQAWISSAFFLFILLTSNPFARVGVPPMEGQDLNPILQDPGLAIHPPLLYLGYVGFSVTFSFAAAALISGRIDPAWERFVRPWTLLAWIFLTLGIAMGSYWAYYTLGWGGFWFWDPVENASLMPWLAGTALLHSAVVMEKRDALKVWTIFLAILAFSLSLLGTFLVRSGVLTSVHAFASDPERGVFILAILVFFIGGSLSLFAFRASTLRQGGVFAPLSREGALVLNNLLLTTSCATVFVGTLYPLFLEALTGEKISVGPPFFNMTFVPIVIPIFFLMPIGQLLAWKRGDLLAAAQRMTVALVVALLFGLALAAWHGEPVLAALGAGLAVYLIVGSFVDIFGRIFVRKASMSLMLARGLGLPRSAWGTAFAHAGVGLSLLGLAATGWGVEKIVTLRLGDQIDLGPWRLQLTKIEPRPNSNFDALVAQIQIRDGSGIVTQIEPARRLFKTRTMTTSEAGIATLRMGQIYVTIAEQNADQSLDMRLYWKPYVSLIWLGGLIMALGGGLCLSDRRLRIGLGRAADNKGKQKPNAQPHPVAAAE